MNDPLAPDAGVPARVLPCQADEELVGLVVDPWATGGLVRRLRERCRR